MMILIPRSHEEKEKARATIVSSTNSRCPTLPMLPLCQRFVTLRRRIESTSVPPILRGQHHDGFDHHVPWCLLSFPLTGGRQHRETAATLRTVSHAGVNYDYGRNGGRSINQYLFQDCFTNMLLMTYIFIVDHSERSKGRHRLACFHAWPSAVLVHITWKYSMISKYNIQNTIFRETTIFSGTKTLLL